MADLGLWFKLWCSADSDPNLDNLDISDFGRWCKLGAYVKSQGTDGSVRISSPSRALCAKFQVATFDDLIRAITRFPHVTMRRDISSVSTETNASVSFVITFDNWLKYQGDYSTNRVHKYRDKIRKMKRFKRRGEEKRGEEKKNISPLIPQGGELKNDQEGFWKSYPLRNGTRGSKKKALDQWKSLTPEQRKKAMEALEAQKTHYEKTKASGGFVAEFPDAWRWLRDRRYEDEVQIPKTQSERFLEILNATK